MAAPGRAPIEVARQAARSALNDLINFIKELIDPPCAVAFGSCAFVVIAAGTQILLFDPDQIRAYAPPHPTRNQIEQANRTAVDFSTVSPADRVRNQEKQP